MVKRFSYRDRDFAFGQTMLTLRTATGLSQLAVAEHLGVSRYAVGAWETGSKYPNAQHLQAFIALAIQRHALAIGREVDQICELWKASHQKIPLNERWIAELIASQRQPATTGWDVDATKYAEPPLSSQISPAHGSRMDWGEEQTTPTFYGRKWELKLLTNWIVHERCRIVSVLGIGGIGKSSLAVSVMQQIAADFEIVVWHSLRDLPNWDELLNDLLRVLAPWSFEEVSMTKERRLARLFEFLQSTRTLLILDNLESVLEEGENGGQLRPDYEGLGRFLRQAAESPHRSCVLLTSREKPNELVAHEGNRSPVRALRLTRLDPDACTALLAEKDVTGSNAEIAHLIEAYAGNPLALKIVAQTIVDLFDGAIVPFLEQGEVIFGGVRKLLAEQFARLSAVEQTVLLWLAVLREPSNLDDLQQVVVTAVSRTRLLEAVERLHRRSLIERGQKPGTFTLQSVVLEYLTLHIIEEASEEIRQGKLSRLIEQGLELAQSKDHIRLLQERLLVAPLLAHLSQRLPDVNMHLQMLLNEMRDLSQIAQGYGPANLIALLRLNRGHLRELDLSRLALRNIYLQGVEMQDTSLSHALLQDNVFNHTFDALLAVDIDQSGNYWAASSSRGEVMVWTANGRTLHSAWNAHSDMIWALKFSPDGHTLATGSWDGMVKVWDALTGALRWSGKHGAPVNSVAFSPDGGILASGSNDSTIAVWELERGIQLQSLPHPAAVTGTGINWTPDGKLLISGDLDGTIRLWEISNVEAAICVQTLAAHSTFVDGLALSPDGQLLISASMDGTVTLWDLNHTELRLRQTIVGHRARIGRVAWSPDGRTIACGGIDKMVWLLDVEEGRYRTVLQGHGSGITGLAFIPDGNSLLSCGDYSLRLWDVTHGQATRVIEGHPNFLNALEWSPDGLHLASGSINSIVTVWDLRENHPQARLLLGHEGAVRGIAWSPDEVFVASSEWDNVIRLWDPGSGTCLRMLQHPHDPSNFFVGLAWSPDGTRLACGTDHHGVLVFEMTTQRFLWGERLFPTLMLHLEWSPDGSQLAGAGANGTVYLWDAEGTLLPSPPGHFSTITNVTWSSTGNYLASGNRSIEGSELFIWDIQNENRLHVFAKPMGNIYTVAWGESEEIVISGDDEGVLRWWHVLTGECLRVRQAHRGTIQGLRRSPDGTKLASCGDDGLIMLWDIQTGKLLQALQRDRPYERLNITGIQGLTTAQMNVLLALGAIADPIQ